MQTLLDHREIEDVLTDYCRHLDRMDLDALSALFSEDCRVAFGPDPHLSAVGRSDLTQSLSRMWRWSRTAHHLCNVRIWIDEDQARSESYVHAWHEKPDGSTAVIFGRYLDRLSRRREGWQITERKMDMNGSDEGFRVPIPQAPRNPPPPDWTPPVGLDG